MFVRSFVSPSRMWNVRQSFTCKFLKWGISHEPLIRKHSYLDHRYPRGLVFIPWLLTPRSMSQGGARGQNLGHLLKVFFSTFLLWKQLMQIVGQTWLSLVTLTCGSWSEGKHDVYFTVQWFCLIPWRLFHVSTSYFGIMNQYDPMFDLKTNAGHCDLYFMVHWFCFPSWRLFDVWTSLFGIMYQYDPTFDLKILVGHCYLYFMVQWFWVISWRLFDVWTSYFRIIGQYNQTFDLKVNVSHCDL